jgi:hypothetical protein
MSPRTGRPRAENPKSNPLHVRLDDQTLSVLDRYCERHGKKTHRRDQGWDHAAFRQIEE